VIVALDTASVDDALRLVDLLGEQADFFKVGLELFTRAGPSLVEELVGRGKRVFLDLKMLDIPNTVERAARSVSELDVEMLTVHASGGAEMMEAARSGLGERTRLLGVTILTSLSGTELADVWGRDVRSVCDEVLRLAELAKGAGADGVVAAASEASEVRRAAGDGFLLVVPGIRPAGADRQDQKRVATPAHAVKSGADYLVVGRPITQAPDPAAAHRSILADARGAAGSD
jgi:orotidine-5'-phosphate decarboxylase